MLRLIYFHPEACFMQDTYHTTAILNLLMLSCIIIDVIHCFVLWRACRSWWDETWYTWRRPQRSLLCASLCGVQAQTVASVKCSDLRASLPLLSPFCSLSQHCEASGGFYYRGDLIKAQHFDDFAAASCLRVCLSISTLLSFSLCINVRACFLDLHWLRQTAFKGRMKVVDCKT